MLQRTTILLSLFVLTIFVSGCGTADSEPVAEPTSDVHDETEHAAVENDVHPEEGPHGGHLVELGEEQYHAEVLHDEGTQTFTIHLLDSTGTQEVAVAEPEILFQVFRDGEFVDYRLPAVLAANQSTASQFQLVDEALVDHLLHAEETRARLHVTIEGQEYIGKIEHSAHDHEGHDH